jgi:hypothetical protein
MTPRPEATLRDLGVSLAVATGIALGLAALLLWPRTRMHAQPLAGAGSMHLDEPVAPPSAAPR